MPNYKPTSEQIELICRLRCETEGLDPDEIIEVVTPREQPMNKDGTGFLAVYLMPNKEDMPRWKSMAGNAEHEATRYNILYDVLDPMSPRNLERVQKNVEEFLAKQKKHPCGCPVKETTPIVDAYEDVTQLELWFINEARIITLGYFPQLPDHDIVTDCDEYIAYELMKHVQVVACKLSKEITAPYHFSQDCGETWSGPITWEQIIRTHERAKQKNPTATAVNPNTPLKGR